MGSIHYENNNIMVIYLYWFMIESRYQKLDTIENSLKMNNK